MFRAIGVTYRRKYVLGSITQKLFNCPWQLSMFSDIQPGLQRSKLETNLWLVILSEPLRMTMSSANLRTITFTTFWKSILKLEKEDSAFIGITKVQSETKRTSGVSDIQYSYPIIVAILYQPKSIFLSWSHWKSTSISKNWIWPTMKRTIII